MFGVCWTSACTVALARVQAMVSDCQAKAEGRPAMLHTGGSTPNMGDIANPRGRSDQLADVSQPLGGKVCYFLIFRFTLRKFCFFLNFLAFCGAMLAKQSCHSPCRTRWHPLPYIQGTPWAVWVGIFRQVVQ